MRSVVQGVIVRMDATSQNCICQLVEKYPGDFRWRCGRCGLGWVKPFVTEKCSACGAIVVEIMRDEDQESARRRKQPMLAAEEQLAELLRQMEAIQNRPRLSGPGYPRPTYTIGVDPAQALPPPPKPEPEIVIVTTKRKIKLS